MAEPKIRDRLVGGWRLMGYEVTIDGRTEHPLGENPRGAILYTPDGYMSAQVAGPGTTQHRHARFDGPDKLTFSVSEPGADGVTTTQTISWARQSAQ